MQRHVSTAGFVLAGLLILGIAGQISAGEQVPFQGTLEGDEAGTPLDPPFTMGMIDAEGNATQLGQFTLEASFIVNTATRTGEGVFIFTAANGDMLTASFTGQAAPTDVPGVVFIVETATIDPTQSTGRFAGATGGFVVERLFDRAAGKTIGTFEGTISSPGANRPRIESGR